MNLTINIDESMFKDVIEKELEAFSKEELHDIVKEMIKEYLKTDSVIKGLFVEKVKDNSYWNGSVYKDAPTNLLKDICSRVDLNDACEEIKDSIVKEIKENSRSIVTELIAKSLSKSLFESLVKTRNLEEEIVKTVSLMNNSN